MGKRRLLYLTVLLGCLVFYTAYREWFSWFCLVSVLCLPALSLLLSLPAALCVRTELELPNVVTRGIPVRPSLRVRCALPAMQVWGKLHTENSLTGEIDRGKTAALVNTDHCGLLLIRAEKLWTSDYLGLFRLPVRKCGGCRMLVEPSPVPVENLPDLRRRSAVIWWPKSGGGFSENHDLRLYRPGDNLRLIHWKASAKTGKLIYREPITAQEDEFLLSLSLCGSPEALDAKLGKFLFVSRYLLSKGVSHGLHCQTVRGLQAFSIADEAGIHAALQVLLSQRSAAQPTPAQSSFSPRQYHIGGDGDEA
jgi:uncharacterized protein (DUF58 family)